MFAAYVCRGAHSVIRISKRVSLIKMSSSSAVQNNNTPKRKHQHANKFQPYKKVKNDQTKDSNQFREISNEDILQADIRALLAKHHKEHCGIEASKSASQTSTENISNGTQEMKAVEGASEESPTLPSFQSILDLDISELSSTGDGLAYDERSASVCVVPFTIPGDKVKARVFKTFKQHSYSLADFVEVTKASPNRDDSLAKCPYFAKCGGCQFQMMAYQKQLDYKRIIVEKAFRNFSGLNPSEVPSVGETMGSPLQYRYRTKLTPHFDGPPGGHRERRQGRRPKWEEVPPIGFMLKNTRKTMDIEDCPIGTDAVRLGMKKERERYTKHIDDYQRGVTLLIRESTTRNRDGKLEVSTTPEDYDPLDHVIEKVGDFVYDRTFVTSHGATSTEFVDDFVFENPAGAFFQNNNSILPTFISYIRNLILPSENEKRENPIVNLIDAYCGSGLFTVTLSSLFNRSVGIDIAPSSIQYAKRNAELNKLPEGQATFISADASNIFGSVKDLAADQTVVVIDPPRKGCDKTFLKLLLDFGPERVVYVSCNVHTQARDIGVLVGRSLGSKEDTAERGPYEIESLRGFDFFPQTGHVEGVAVLRKRDLGKQQ